MFLNESSVYHFILYAITFRGSEYIIHNGGCACIESLHIIAGRSRTIGSLFKEDTDIHWNVWWIILRIDMHQDI